MTEHKLYSMQELVLKVLASDKFQEIVKDGEKGYYDKHEEVFIPKKVVPSLIKELTLGPSVVTGTAKLDGYFSLCQVRIKRALKSNVRHHVIRQYNQIFLRYLSTEFLKIFINSKVNFAALYIDIVGSTLLSMRLSPEKLSSLVSIFTQEMSSIVPLHHGFVLKYAGDSVIAFFPEPENFTQMCDNALGCAMDMRELLKNGINTALVTEGFDPINIRIGIEAGVNQIMQIGGDVDIVGHTMNIAAKVTSMAKPNGICIGHIAYLSLDGNTKKDFSALTLEPSSWKYQTSDGKLYQVYEYLGDKAEPSVASKQEITKIDTPKI